MERELKPSLDYGELRKQYQYLMSGYYKRWGHHPRVRPVLHRDGSTDETGFFTCTPYFVTTGGSSTPLCGIIRTRDYEVDYDGDVTVWYVRGEDLVDFAFRRVTGVRHYLDPLLPIVWPRPHHVLTTDRVLTLDSAVAVTPRQSRKRKLRL